MLLTSILKLGVYEENTKKIITVSRVFICDKDTCTFTCEEKVNFFQFTKDKFPNFLWELVY